MHHSPHIRLVLQHLYALAEATEPASITLIARDLGLERHVVAQALLALDRAGLADCARVRLTLQGLAVAVSLAAAARGARALSAAA